MAWSELSWTVAVIVMQAAECVHHSLMGVTNEEDKLWCRSCVAFGNDCTRQDNHKEEVSTRSNMLNNRHRTSIFVWARE